MVVTHTPAHQILIQKTKMALTNQTLGGFKTTWVIRKHHQRWPTAKEIVQV
jgi:hypothetical protein